MARSVTRNRLPLIFPAEVKASAPCFVDVLKSAKPDFNHSPDTNSNLLPYETTTAEEVALSAPLTFTVKVTVFPTLTLLADAERDADAAWAVSDIDTDKTKPNTTHAIQDGNLRNIFMTKMVLSSN